MVGMAEANLWKQSGWGNKCEWKFLYNSSIFSRLLKSLSRICVKLSPTIKKLHPRWSITKVNMKIAISLMILFASPSSFKITCVCCCVMPPNMKITLTSPPCCTGLLMMNVVMKNSKISQRISELKTDPPTRKSNPSAKIMYTATASSTMGTLDRMNFDTGVSGAGGAVGWAVWGNGRGPLCIVFNISKMSCELGSKPIADMGAS